MNEPSLKQLKPWVVKPFQLLFHGEIHFKSNSDYDKRMAYINFDNSIEVSIYTFMHCNANKKGKDIYTTKNLDDVKNSFFKKLEVFENYLKKEKLQIRWDKDNINYYHEQRSNQYHAVSLSSPDTSELYTIRQIAIWIFSVLFQISDVETLLQSAITESEKSFPEIPQEFTKPKIDVIQQNHENSLFIASILGGWDDNSQGDNEIIGEVTSGF